MKRWVLTGLLILSAGGGTELRAAPTDPAQTSYETAFGLTRAGSFGLAEAAWRQFLSQYPDHPLAGNAQYFLGETFYGRNDFARAAIAYGIGADKYPQSEVAAQTLLKLGIALGRSGETAPACGAFARLERQFPTTNGVIHERAVVEQRQYHCTETPAAPAQAAAPAAEAPVKLASVAPPGAENRPPPSNHVAAAPPAIAPTPPGGSVPDRSGAPESVATVEPAPPAQPVAPVDVKPLSGVDAERAAAKADLFVTPPPSVTATRAPRMPLSRESAHGATSSDSIRTAQTLLAALDYDPGPVDGQPSPKLREAVRTFEKRNDLRPDGEVSDRLLQRLSAAIVTRKAAAATPAAPKPAQTLTGTGFVVSKSGFVITSYHLVAECKEIRIRSLASESVAAPIVASDSHNDLALLRLKSAAGAAVSFRDGHGPRHGEGVVVTGLSLGDEGSSDFYLTTGIINALSGGRDDNGVLKISAPISAESGGAPVFDTTGHVIAIIGGTTPGKAAGGGAAQSGSLALRATIARNFLDAHNVDYESAATGSELKAADIGDAAKDVVVLIECRR